MSSSLSPSASHRVDELRRFASDLATGLGVPPARASSLATHLLWFDAAGASSHGIATLPKWLDRIDRKEIDPKAEGRAGSEKAGTAVFDAQNGITPLALESAARVASEKARDVGVGIVRVKNLPAGGPAAPAAAGLAIGPNLAVIVGPGPSIAVAVPTSEGLPLVYDSALAGSRDPIPTWMGEWSPWIAAIAGFDGWAILALSVAAFEPLAQFHARIAANAGASLVPRAWEIRRAEARERGILLDPATIDALKSWGDRLRVPCPSSFGG